MTKLSTIACALAMLGMAAPGAAYAQTIIGGVAVSESDLARIKRQCDALAASENVSLSADLDAELIEPSPDPASSWPRGPDGMDEALSDFDLDTLTLQKCKAAGLVR